MSQQQQQQKIEQSLVVFDFDRSLIEDDSDHFTVRRLLANGDEIVQTCLKTMQWTDLMDHVFQLAHKQGATPDTIRQCLRDIPFVRSFLLVGPSFKRKQSPFMVQALQHAKQVGNARLSILSDANTIFIEEILQANNVRSLFSDIVTNPAVFDDEGRLRITRFIKKDDTPHGCQLGTCAINICKGQEIAKLIPSYSSYKTIVYVGDGRNDFCPATKLGETDYLLARKNFALHKFLAEGTLTPEGHLLLPNKSVVKARVRYWDTHEDIHELFNEIFS